VTLPAQTFHMDNIQAAYLSINHCEIPNSFYIVQYFNNQIVIDGITYVIPRGNYNANTMITALLNLLPGGFFMSFDNSTTKFTLRNSFTDFIIDASNPACTINAVLGLGNQDLYSLQGIDLIFPNCCNFIPLQRLNIRTPYFKFANFDLTNGTSDIILPLQNNAGQGSMINYINQTQNKFLIEDRNITTFKLSITDDLGHLINFNGIQSTITLEINVDYEELPKTANLKSMSSIGGLRQFM
jgi:hypothetical protein